MVLLPKKVLLWFSCFALIATSVKATCERDENGNIIEKPESDGFGAMFRRVGCKIEKGVETIGEKAKSLGGEVKEAFKSGIKSLAKPFQSSDDDDEKQNQAEIVTSVNEPTIDIRTKEIFKTDNEFIAPVGTPKPGSPESLDDRFLINSPKICPEGQRKDSHNNCRDV